MSTYGTEPEIADVEHFDDYQDRAMRTNFWPRMYTEEQVREMIDIASYEEYIGSYTEDEVSRLLDEHTTPFNLAIYQMLGLAEEVGELAGKFKKTLRDDNGIVTPEREEAILKELGDGQWYKAAIARAFNWTLSHVARENLRKLESRANRGTLRGEGDDR